MLDAEPHTSSSLETVSADLATKGLCWLFEHRARWNLSMNNVANLLGGISVSTVDDWEYRTQHGEQVALPIDVVERLSLLLGIHSALAMITPVDREALAWEWFQTPIDLYGLKGQSIRDYLLSKGTLDSFYFIRRQLEAARI